MIGISVIGLGKLGACMLASFASKGFKVIGVEIDKKRADMLRQGKSFHYEPNLEEYLTRYKQNISITDNYREAILNTNVTFVVVNTPSTPDGSFSTEQLVPACKQIGMHLREKSDYHLIAVTCTIMPSTMRNVVLPAIESSSGKKGVKDFGLCYNPEFIALGSVIHDFLNPDFVLIGESDSKAGDILADIYEKIIENPKIRRMSLENAEITKIALNSYITMKISFANLLAELCERIPSGNVDVVTESLGMDRRIGKNYLKGAMSFGGPCFPRDNRAFSLAARLYGCNLEIPDTIDHVNQRHIEYIANKILEYCNNGKVAILGGSYKPNSDVIEASPSLEIAKHLVNKGIKVVIHDPVALNNIKKEYGIFQCAETIDECLKDADVCVIATPWEQYKSLNMDDFEKMKGSVIIDCWRILKPIPSNKFKFIQIGIGKS